MPDDRVGVCSVRENGDYVSVVRSISGSPHVMLGSAVAGNGSNAMAGGGDVADSSDELDGDAAEADLGDAMGATNPASTLSPPATDESRKAKPIFIGHGGRKGPLALISHENSGVVVGVIVSV